MDKNTIIGLVLIGVLLVGFSILSRPSQEQLEAQQHYYDSIAQVQQREAELKAKQEAALENERIARRDSSALFHQALHGTDQEVTIENNVASLTLHTKGGVLYQSVLKEYKEQDKQTPLTLVRGGDAEMNFLFYNSDEIIETKDYYFTPVQQTDSSVTMRLQADSASYIDFCYTMHPDNYLVDFTIQAVGMEGKLASTNRHVDIEWSERARQIEKGYTYENRLAELTYKRDGEGSDYLNANQDDQEDIAETLNWVAFKNQFFSAVMLSEAGFQKLTALDKGRDKDWELNRLVYLGWPLFRWINKWIIINLFDWLQGWGLSMGVVLLFLTIIVKAAVFPATWKTYLSSAKMRVLKPKIDEINKKYPKQEDAMKKQQEIMGVYSQYGVSPMGGCLPMLIQFPIFIALFMFIPSAIELRQQSFLWADDLSTYDAIITFPFHIPFMGSHLSLFCLLMTVTNILNAKFMMQQQDTGANPQMAAMKWMHCWPSWKPIRRTRDR